MDKCEEGPRSGLKRTTKLVLAVTLHNLPEGMAVGIVCAGWLYGNTTISFTGALALAIGIAIQNFPEGAIVSVPLLGEGVPKGKTFLYGVLSGIVEPIPIIGKRMKNEEKVLEEGLEGYKEYKTRVRYKVIPFVW